MRITRLGAGVDRTRALDTEAVARTQAVLGEYRTVMDDHGVPAGNVRISATSAARDATNRDGWFDAAEAVVGARPEVLTGTEEAALSFRGATAGLDPARGPFLVFDLGGGSTELAYGTDTVTASLSLEIGCVRLTERFIESDPPRPEELTAAISYAESWLDDVLRQMPGAASAPTVIGLAGTVSTVAAVEIGLATYDRSRIHGFTLTKEAAEDVFRTLATESRADRVHNPGLEEARADVIVGGCCALVAVYRTLGLDEIVVSEADILDGLALSVLDRAATG
ncbi:exopolyphosphatase [Iamia sp. SCSIO 61187]|nr:exopolyphosphatase [Iamia sp. SCSIO 61187]